MSADSFGTRLRTLGRRGGGDVIARKNFVEALSAGVYMKG